MRLAMIPALLLLGIGCSGVNSSHSISPASFLIPGLLQISLETNAPIASLRIPTPHLITVASN